NETFARRAAADRRRHEIEDSKNRGEWIDPAQGKILLADWIKKYQANNTRNLRRSSQAVEEACLRTHVVPHLGNRQVASIRFTDVQEWVATLSNAGKAP